MMGYGTIPGGKKILVFNVNWIGDTVFSSPVLRALRRSFPDSHIACVIPPRCLPVLEGNPYLDEIIVLDEKGRHKGFFGLLRFAAQLRKKRFDRVYLLHRSMTRALICLLAGIPVRVGYDTAKRGFLLTRRFPAPDIMKVHRAEYYMGVLRGDGLEADGMRTDFAVSDEDRRKAAGLIAGLRGKGGPVVALNPGGNWMPKRWPEANWAALARRLADEFDAALLITGGPEDTALAKRIGKESKVPILSLCGSCSLKVFAAVTQLVDVFITADSGPLHIANAAGCPRIIALFGPTSPELTGPVEGCAEVLHKDVGCPVPCYVRDCPDNRCMKAISVEDVVALIRKPCAK